MRDVDIAWATGLFEGEGCILIMDRSKDGHHRLPVVRLAITMTDRDVLERFCEIAECGKVGPERRYGRPHHKPAFMWQISSRAEVERLLLAFRPWFGERRGARADEALAEIAKLNMVCEGCGATFRSHRTSSRFCSTACRNRWHYMNRRPAERPSKKGRPRTL